MPPNDNPANNHLLTLGTAAVLAVFGAGFVRTQKAAERFEGESRRRHPVAPITAVSTSADTSVPAQTAPVVTTHAVSGAKQAAKVTAKVTTKRKPDTTSAISVAVQPTVTTAPVVADTTSTNAPVDSAMVARDLKDGVYTGWGTSRHGDIESRVEIKNGRIISASIAQCLTMYSVYWIAALPPRVVKRQSPEVDVISGATESSYAFSDGIIEALKKAK
ncbi:MAG: FMN-binding protein [Gemmatimonadaceae bacterium]